MSFNVLAQLQKCLLGLIRPIRRLDGTTTSEEDTKHQGRDPRIHLLRVTKSAVSARRRRRSQNRKDLSPPPRPR